MSVFTDLVGYDLEVEWLLTWYPITSTSALRNAQIRGGTFVHSIKEFPEEGDFYEEKLHDLREATGSVRPLRILVLRWELRSINAEFSLQACR